MITWRSNTPLLHLPEIEEQLFRCVFYGIIENCPGRGLFSGTWMHWCCRIKIFFIIMWSYFSSKDNLMLFLCHFFANWMHCINTASEFLNLLQQCLLFWLKNYNAHSNIAISVFYLKAQHFTHIFLRWRLGLCLNRLRLYISAIHRCLCFKMCK